MIFMNKRVWMNWGCGPDWEWELRFVFLGRYYVSTIAYLKAVFVVGFPDGLIFAADQVAGQNCMKVCLLCAITTQADLHGKQMFLRTKEHRNISVQAAYPIISLPCFVHAKSTTVKLIADYLLSEPR
jgi:hypothetical protein